MSKYSLLLLATTVSLGSLAVENNELEQLLGASVDEHGITFQVTSNGCTQRDDFSFEVKEVLQEMSPMLPALEHHHYITVYRNQPDACDAFIPYGTHIFLSFQELGIGFGKFHIQNAIGGDKFQSMP